MNAVLHAALYLQQLLIDEDPSIIAFDNIELGKELGKPVVSSMLMTIHENEYPKVYIFSRPSDTKVYFWIRDSSITGNIYSRDNNIELIDISNLIINASYRCVNIIGF